MRLVDANLLLHAYHPSSDHHKAAKDWLEGALSSATPFCLAWQTITAFIRISTSSRVFGAPFTTRESVGIVREWLAVPSVVVLGPGERHWRIFAELLENFQCRGQLVIDAHLAALAIEHGASLYTTDKDFNRFDQLEAVNPLA